MADLADFHGIQFAAEFDLFTDTDDFEDTPAIYVIYTEQGCIEIVSTDHLKTDVETNTNAPKWLKMADGKNIFVAFHFDDDADSRQEKVKHLKSKMHPLIK